MTGKSRTHFRAWPEKELSAAQEAAFHALLEHRLAGHPIAHLIGSREFWSREFIVTPDVLIPRPETELLVERALERLPTGQAARIADLGTGSGAIAITLALERPCAEITALDSSPAALDIARQNALRLGAKNIRFIHSDWFSALGLGERFDLLVSNPPYIAEDDPHLKQGDLRFEPFAALASGPDGLGAIRHLIEEAPAHLHPGGGLWFEHGYDQAEAVRELLKTGGFIAIESYTDLQGHGRVSGGRWGGELS